MQSVSSARYAGPFDGRSHAQAASRVTAVVAALVAFVLVAGMLVGCAPRQEGAPPAEVLADFPASDMSGYACLEGYTGETAFVDMTVADVIRKVDAGGTFALYFGYADCPWCNVIVPTVNELALEFDQPVGYVNTRAKPEWKSNADIDGYDLLVERYGDSLGTDDAGEPHLYVPHVFFFKDGQLVFDHAGTVPEQDTPDQALTEAQRENLAAIFRRGFNAIS